MRFRGHRGPSVNWHISHLVDAVGSGVPVTCRDLEFSFSHCCSGYHSASVVGLMFLIAAVVGR